MDCKTTVVPTDCHDLPADQLEPLVLEDDALGHHGLDLSSFTGHTSASM
jgi:hypothetical protein